jgi:putative chitinase
MGEREAAHMSLANPTAFFDSMRAGLLGPVLTAEEVNGCNAILEAMDGLPLSYVAYALATAYRETASTMQPIREYGGPSYLTRMYDVSGARPQLALTNGNTCAGDGVKYCGRGYVQLTWKNNYARAAKECGVDLVASPDTAMRADVAAKIMRAGMVEGWFTGKKLSDYLPIRGPAERGMFVKCRYIINGSDHAGEIADHAMAFQRALVLGGWK